MTGEKRIHILNNKIKRIQEKLSTKEFLGDDEGYEALEQQLIKAQEKLDESKAKGGNK